MERLTETAIAGLWAIGCLLVGLAIRQERLMQRHRRPGISYRDVTFRRDGGWQRRDLFTPDGLHHQRCAAGYGWSGLVTCLAAFLLQRLVG